LLAGIPVLILALQQYFPECLAVGGTLLFFPRPAEIQYLTRGILYFMKRGEHSYLGAEDFPTHHLQATERDM